ncbi:hypothetical protein [Thermoproteus tenax]|uniref:Uncharacterized protein n=1 Tax=Thermoproteus tenax (strain ATCC 35583 / DSM 2078 / JCM 9277 / NBRC 100435 / Kra 1) TaxID=768679 RepID=G4RPZ4_THETK|nr:hypothetical protein [Thermoproteus tenax]CCC81639.1 hypothetical protein TTX_0993 [Thermoproteus tenax Kra 1]
MIVHTDQLNLLYKTINAIPARRVEPLVIKGERVDLIWPPQRPSIPIDLLEIMPRGIYVIIRKNIITLVP